MPTARPSAALLFLLLVALAGASLALVEPDPASPPGASVATPAPLGPAASTPAPTPAPTASSAPAPSSAPVSSVPAASAAPATSAGPVVSGAVPGGPAAPAEGEALVIGTVRWPDGRVAANVAIHGIGEVHAHGGGTYTDATGLFTVPVPAGPFAVQAWSPDRKAAAVGAYVAEAGRRLTLDLTLAPLVPITVWLVDPEGQRRPADWVQGEALSTPKLDLQSGRDALLVLTGRVRVTACHPDGSPRATAELDVGTAPAELVLPIEASGRLEGVVVGPDDAPVADLEVVCRRAPRDGLRRTGSGWSARTDAAGRFAIDDLPPDRFLLEARQLQRMWWGQVEATLEPAAAGELRLPLARMSTIRGRLVYPTSVTRPPMVPIDLRRRGADEHVRPLHTRTGQAAFECAWLPDGDYVVSVPEDRLPALARALGVPRVVVHPAEATLAGGDAEVELRVELP